MHGMAKVWPSENNTSCSGRLWPINCCRLTLSSGKSNSVQLPYKCPILEAELWARSSVRLKHCTWFYIVFHGQYLKVFPFYFLNKSNDIPSLIAEDEIRHLNLLGMPETRVLHYLRDNVYIYTMYNSSTLFMVELLYMV